MKKVLFFTIFLLGISLSHAQEYPTGSKEIKAGDKEALKRLRSIPDYKFSQKTLKAARARANADEPVTFVDNSKSKYFPSIISQNGNSCVFASTISYLYEYEMNKLYDREASPENRFNYQYIYALENEGTNQGGFLWNVTDPIMDNGVPFLKDHAPAGVFEWMSGSEKYINGMVNGIEGTYKFQFIKKEDDGYYYHLDQFEAMKQVLIDDGTGKGGKLIQFNAFAHSMGASMYDGPGSTDYKAIIHHFGESGMHSMIIVGFDDDVEWDYNGDGEISADEKGAFICVNTWGESWGDKGRFYAPYKTFLQLFQGSGGTGNGPIGLDGPEDIGKACFTIVPKVNNVTTAIKARVKHGSRNDLKFIVGVSSDPSAVEPEFTKEMYVMDGQGGDRRMDGYKSGEIELALNVSDLAEKIGNSGSAKYFLTIESNTNNISGGGSLEACSLIKVSSGNITNEYLGKVMAAPLSDGIYAGAVMLEKTPNIAEGVNMDIDYLFYEGNLELYINAAQKGYLLVDFVSEGGEVVETVISKEVNAGGTVHKIDLSAMSGEAVALRISVDNKLIYKRLK